MFKRLFWLVVGIGFGFGVSFWLVYLAARSTGVAVRTGALLALGGFVVSSPALGLRPQLLAVVLFAVLLWVTAGRRSHPGRLWAAPVLAAICANVHGSLVIFPVVVGIACHYHVASADVAAAVELVPARHGELVQVDRVADQLVL